MSPGMLVLSILLAVALVQAVVWTLVIRATRRRAAAQRATLDAELAKHPNEPLLRGPIRAYLRRGHARSQCMLALTGKRLLVAGNHASEILLSQVSSVTENTWFNGEYRNGYEWMILTTVDGAQVGLMARDGDASWPNAVREAMAKL